MSNYDLHYRVKELSDTINLMKSEIDDLRNRSKEDEFWDNSDMIRRLKISRRTLATWRSEGLIDFVQLGNKILYTKENRNSFIMKNLVKGEDKDEVGN